MKHNEWEQEIKDTAKLPTEKIKEYQKAIETLKEWPTFKKEFDWTGLFCIGLMLGMELKKRGVEA